MKTLIVMTASLCVLGHSLVLAPMALAQDSQRNQPPKSLRAQPTTQSNSDPAPAAVPAAPVGHRQPKPGDLPPETGKNDPGNIDAQDRQLDRMIKNICKGC